MCSSDLFGFWLFPCFVGEFGFFHAYWDDHTFHFYLLELSEVALSAYLSLHLCPYSEFCRLGFSPKMHGYYHDLEDVIRSWMLHLYYEVIPCSSFDHHPSFLWNFLNLHARLVRVLLLLVGLWQCDTLRNSRKVFLNVSAQIGRASCRERVLRLV